MVAAPENLSFPPGSDGDVLVMEPVPSRISRSVSFKDEVSEIANADETSDVHRATDDSALPSFATYSEKNDNGALARAAKEIALKMGRSLHVASTGPALDGSNNDEGGIGLSYEVSSTPDEVPSSAAGMWAELKELRQRLNELEDAQRTMVSSQPTCQSRTSSEDAREQDASSAEPPFNPPLPPTSHPSSVPHIITDFGFGNMLGEDRKDMPASSNSAVPETAAVENKSPTDAETNLMAYFTPLNTPSSTPRSNILNEGGHHAHQLPLALTVDSFSSNALPPTHSSQPNSPSRTCLSDAATKLAPSSPRQTSQGGSSSSSPVKHGRSPPPSPKQRPHPGSPQSLNPAPSLLSLPEQIVLPSDLGHMGVSPTAQKTCKYSGNDSDDSCASSIEDR